MRDDEFEWDDEKARANLVKHKLPFEIARLVFDDVLKVDEPDDAMDYGEDRYQVIGMVDGRLITVIYTLRVDRIRMISARKATPHERTRYEEQNR